MVLPSLGVCASGPAEWQAGGGKQGPAPHSSLPPGAAPAPAPAPAPTPAPAPACHGSPCWPRCVPPGGSRHQLARPCPSPLPEVGPVLPGHSQPPGSPFPQRSGSRPLGAPAGPGLSDAPPCAFGSCSLSVFVTSVQCRLCNLTISDGRFSLSKLLVWFCSPAVTLAELGPCPKACAWCLFSCPLWGPLPFLPVSPAPSSCRSFSPLCWQGHVREMETTPY